MKTILSIAQIVISILLIVFILLQQRGTALGSIFGGGESSYTSRRGIQKNIFWGSCFLGVLFIILAILNLVL